MIKLEDMTAYTVEECAEKLHVLPETIRRNIRNGSIKANKVCRRWYVTDQALADYVAGNETTEGR